MKEDIINQINSLLELEVFKNTYQELIPENLLSKKISINIEDISFDISLIFEKDKFFLTTSSDKNDVTVTGTLSSFIFYASSKGSDLFSSKINISGDVETANALNSFFKESDLLLIVVTNLLGQKSASTILSIVDPIKDKFADINKKNNNSLAEFLKYDINLIPTKSEINEFIDQVDDIKSRTEKLLKKMK